jgi:hypothetical protein
LAGQNGQAVEELVIWGAISFLGNANKEGNIYRSIGLVGDRID